MSKLQLVTLPEKQKQQKLINQALPMEIDSETSSVINTANVEEETRESAYRLVIDPFTFKRSHSYDFFYFYTVPPFFVYLVLSFVTLAIMSIDFFIYLNSTGG